MTCSTTHGVRVDYPEGDENPVSPHVTVDLQGHTLRGTDKLFSIGVGGGSDNGGPVHLRVTNGRLQHWYWGGFTGSTGNVDGVKLVDNRIGWGCNSSCSLANSYISKNNEGLHAADARVSIDHTIFIKNSQAIHMGIGRLRIERSAFLKNDVGITSWLSGASVSESLFVKNGTAIQAADETGAGACADLSHVIFRRNGTDVVEDPSCAQG